jgi:hypothetical protein
VLPSTAEASPPAGTSPAAVSSAGVSPAEASRSAQGLPVTGASHANDYVRLGLLLMAAGFAIALAGGLRARRGAH